jgi:crotonobetainyl-CoA:carnitine CoA-transferase CaiB-like acyl-CoA transferase
MSGMMKGAGRNIDPPHPAPTYVADAVTAYTAFESVLAGLLHRERTGEGQYIAVNMLDAIIAFQLQEMSIYLQGGLAQVRTDEPHASVYIRAPYGAFQTSDDDIVLAFPDLKKFGARVDIPELTEMDSERDGHQRRDEIHRLVAAKLVERSAAEWLRLFEQCGIWAGPVYSYENVKDDPQVIENGSIITYEHPTEGTVTTPGFPIKFSLTPSEIRFGAPLNGQHSREILEQLGMSPERVTELAQAGVIAINE